MPESDIRFLTIDQFKAQMDIESIEVLQNETTGKVFMSGSNGQTWKVEQDIDPDSPMKVLIENGDMDDACLVNVKSKAKTLFTI